MWGARVYCAGYTKATAAVACAQDNKCYFLFLYIFFFSHSICVVYLFGAVFMMQGKGRSRRIVYIGELARWKIVGYVLSIVLLYVYIRKAGDL